MHQILVIDDDRELCALIKRSVLMENIEADCCYNGSAGLEQLKKKAHHLVITDGVRPGSDGFEDLEHGA